MQTMFEVSRETIALRDRLLMAPVDGLVSYDVLSAAIGQDVRAPKWRGRLASARWMALRDEGAVFSAVRNEGLKRLADDAKIASGQDSLRRIRGTARRGDRRVSAGLKSNSITQEERAIGNGYKAVFAMIDNLSRTHMVKTLATNTSDTATVRAGRLDEVRL